jgi:hypothetical protein
VKDYRDHAVATLFGQIRVRLPRFRCARCGGHEAGHDWPSHCRSTPELDQLQAHLSALMTYRVAAEVMAQMFPIDAGNDPETLRCHTLIIGADLRDQAAVRPDAAAPAIAVTLDSTFIRSCEEGERHLEVRVGNVETASGRRQVLGAVAKADTDIKVLIRRRLDAVGRSADTVLAAFTDGCSDCGTFSRMPASLRRRSWIGSTSACGCSTLSKSPVACQRMIRHGSQRKR